MLTTSSTRRNQAESHFLRLPPEIRNNIYEHAFSAATVRTIRNPSGSISRYIVVNGGTSALLVCRQVNLEAARYEYSHTILTFPDTVYFPELVYVVQKSCSSAVQTLNLTLGMVSSLRMRVIGDRGRPLEAAWPARESVKEVLNALKCINVTMELTDFDRIRNMESIRKALKDKDGTMMALKPVFCNPDLEVQG